MNVQLKSRSKHFHRHPVRKKHIEDNDNEKKWYVLCVLYALPIGSAICIDAKIEWKRITELQWFSVLRAFSLPQIKTRTLWRHTINTFAQHFDIISMPFFMCVRRLFFFIYNISYLCILMCSTHFSISICFEYSIPVSMNQAVNTSKPATRQLNRQSNYAPTFVIINLFRNLKCRKVISKHW